MKVFIDNVRCVGCHVCREACPEIFEINRKNQAIARVEKIPSEFEENCQIAAIDCPIQCIFIE